MKKGILFAGGVALTLAFAGCDDGSARIAELQAELDAAKTQTDSLSLVAQENLTLLTTTYQYKVDSLQYVIDSLTAPKGTTVTKPKPKPAPTTNTPAPTTPTNDKGSKMDGGSTTNTDQKNDKMGGGTTTDKTNTDKKKSKMEGGNP